MAAEEEEEEEVEVGRALIGLVGRCETVAAVALGISSEDKLVGTSGG